MTEVAVVFEPSKNKKAVPVTQANPFPVAFGAGASSQFGEALTVERTPIIELNSAYGVTAVRDVTSVTNSGAITSPGTGEILLSTGATASSTADLYSGERGRYIPGYGAQVGVGVRIPVSPTGEQSVKWGLITPDGNEGFYFGMDATGLYAAVVRSGTETEKVYQSSFNLDLADGSGDTGYVLDVSKGNIFQIDFTWYGYGQILFGVLGVVGGYQKFIPLHQYRPTDQTSIRTPNLPVTVLSTNGATASDFDVYVGGRQYSIIGEYAPKYRATGQERASVSVGSGVVEPLVSFRSKSGFEDRSLQVESITAIVQTTPVVAEIYINPTLTGASWANPTNYTAAETAVETDVSATSLSGGTLIWSELLPAGSGTNRAASKALNTIDIPENQVVTLAFRGVGGTATVTAQLVMREEW